MTAGERHPRPDPGAATVSAADLINVLILHWRLIVGLPVACAVLIAGLTFVQPRTYTAYAAFAPQSAGSQSGYGGLAAQLGIQIPVADIAQSPLFYVDLIRSNALLEAVVEAPYRVEASRDGNGAATLIQVYGIADGSERERRADAVESLRRNIGVSTSIQTGIVRFQVSDRSAGLAQQIAGRMLELVNEFNLRTRQTQAAQERRFIEERLRDVTNELRAAEIRVEEFLRQNRIFQNSPELAFRHEALQREVGMRQAIFTSLMEAHEQARIREARDTPVITVVDPPIMPTRPDPRGLVQKTLLAAFLGVIIALVIAFGWELGRQALRQDQEAFARLLATRDERLPGLRRHRRQPVEPAPEPAGMTEGE
jgi:tyrosine-protein kinase Etk/Wzc